MSLTDLKAPQVLNLITDASCDEVPGGILAGWLEDDSSSKESTCCSGVIMLYRTQVHDALYKIIRSVAFTCSDRDCGRGMGVMLFCLHLSCLTVPLARRD
jgi:hypothetical protein